MTILIYPNPKLQEKASEVRREDIISGKIQNLIAEMTKLMLAAQGVGLAATQVGELLRIIVAAPNGMPPQAFINPEILRYSWAKVKSLEGCLSLPGVQAVVRRSKTVRVKALDSCGKIVKFKAAGLLSFILQHEIDHLNGILIIDKAKK